MAELRVAWADTRQSGERFDPADDPSDPRGWVTADGRGLGAAPRHPAEDRMKGSMCVCVCVWRVGWVTSACTWKSSHAHIHQQQQLHLSFDMGELNDRGREAKKKLVFLPLYFSFFFPLHLYPSWPHSPALTLHTEHSGQTFSIQENPSHLRGTHSLVQRFYASVKMNQTRMTSKK